MDHFVWDFQKEIFKIGSYGPRWYGLMFAIGFMVGYGVTNKIFVKEGRSTADLSSLLTHIMIGTIAGARLGHILFYTPEVLINDPLQIFRLWEGGLASHGGTIGVLLAVWFYKRKHPDQSYIWLADTLSIGVAFTAGCIRIGNFFNSEILGRPSDLPWAIIFAETKDNIPRHPSMLYESLSYLTLAVVLYQLYRKKRGIPSGQLVGLMLTWIFTSRILIEFTKENQVPFENSMALNMGQLLSIPFVIIGVLLISQHFQRWFPMLNLAQKQKDAV